MSRKMKESGVEWIGEIPIDYRITKIKFFANIFNGNSIKDEMKESYTDKLEAYPYISTKDIEVGINRINYDNGLYTKRNDSTFKIAQKNSVLMCIEGGSAGKKIGYTNQPVTFVNKLCCFNAKSNNTKYLYYYMQSSGFTEQFKLNITGLIGGVSTSILKTLLIPLPSRASQDNIVTFLDSTVAQIDSIVERTKETINDYKSLKQSIITEAVTKGLNKGVEMKDSGIKWIGEIPKTWIITKLKNEVYLRARLGWKGLKADEYVDEGIIFLATPNIKGVDIDFKNVNYISRERYDESPEIKISLGDVLLTKDGSTLGTLNVVRHLPNEATVNGSIALLTPSSELNSIFLYYFFNSSYIQNIIQLKKDGMGVPHLFQRDIREFLVLIPRMDEQIQIGQYLDLRCGQLDSLIAQKQKLVEGMESYKKSLIYECVTGKIEII